MSYTRIEYERRFLVTDPSWHKPKLPAKRLEDLYIRGTAMRVRVVTDVDTGERLVKLTKKTPTGRSYAHELSRILLGYDELELFRALPGDRLVKVRHYVKLFADSLTVVAVDVFEGELTGLVTCEIEAQSPEALLAIEPPAFARREITGDPAFTGAVLARATAAELADRLRTLS